MLLYVFVVAVLLLAQASAEVDKTIASQMNPCYSPTWTYYKEKNKCLYANNHTFKWFAAQRYCREIGGRLAVIPDDETNQVIKDMLPGQNVWIGLTDHIHEGVHIWEDGTTLKKDDYSPWGEGQPYGRPNSCVMLTAGFNWTVNRCQVTTIVSVCEMEDVNLCLITNGGCDHQCVPTSVRERSCHCHKGFELIHEVACRDIDECEYKNAGCDQGCRNVDGSYQCFCHSGFNLTDQKMCAAEAMLDTKSVMTLTSCLAVPTLFWLLSICIIRRERSEIKKRLQQMPARSREDSVGSNGSDVSNRNQVQNATSDNKESKKEKKKHKKDKVKES